MQWFSPVRCPVQISQKIFIDEQLVPTSVGLNRTFRPSLLRMPNGISRLGTCHRLTMLKLMNGSDHGPLHGKQRADVMLGHC